MASDGSATKGSTFRSLPSIWVLAEDTVIMLEDIAADFFGILVTCGTTIGVFVDLQACAFTTSIWQTVGRDLG